MLLHEEGGMESGKECSEAGRGSPETKEKEQPKQDISSSDIHDLSFLNCEAFLLWQSLQFPLESLWTGR